MSRLRLEFRGGWTLYHHDHPAGWEDERCCMCDVQPCEEITALKQAEHDQMRLHWAHEEYGALLKEAVALGYVQTDPWAAGETEP